MRSFQNGGQVKLHEDCIVDQEEVEHFVPDNVGLKTNAKEKILILS